MPKRVIRDSDGDKLADFSYNCESGIIMVTNIVDPIDEGDELRPGDAVSDVVSTISKWVHEGLSLIDQEDSIVGRVTKMTEEAFDALEDGVTIRWQVMKSAEVDREYCDEKVKPGPIAWAYYRVFLFVKFEVLIDTSVGSGKLISKWDQTLASGTAVCDCAKKKVGFKEPNTEKMPTEEHACQRRI